MKGLLILLVFASQLLFAQDIDAVAKAIAQAQADVEGSTQELIELRNDIQQKRLPLSTEIADLQAEALRLREQVTQMRNASNLRQNQRENLQRDVNQLQQETVFVDTVFSEYRRSLETRVSLAELGYVQSKVQGEPEALWDNALAWLKTRRGGFSYEGQVMDAEGREQLGTMMVLGPVGYFVNEEMGGVVLSRANSVLPGVFALESADALGQLQALAQGGSAVLPLDVSGGDAIKVEEAKGSVVDHLRKGGVIVVPLLLLGVISLFMALHKLIDLKRLKVTLNAEPRIWLKDLNTGGAEAEALEKAGKLGDPLASLVTAAIQHRHASREHLEEILHEHVLAVVPRLERSLGTLAVFGGVAPLLGLLGTVTGMIHTFQLVTLFGTGNSAPLSGGISEALVTTEVGLIIAIPILLVHAFLARRAKSLLGDLEQSGVQLVNILKSSTPSV